MDYYRIINNFLSKQADQQELLFGDENVSKIIKGQNSKFETYLATLANKKGEIEDSDIIELVTLAPNAEAIHRIKDLLVKLDQEFAFVFAVKSKDNLKKILEVNPKPILQSEALYSDDEIEDDFKSTLWKVLVEEEGNSSLIGHIMEYAKTSKHKTAIYNLIKENIHDLSLEKASKLVEFFEDQDERTNLAKSWIYRNSRDPKKMLETYDTAPENFKNGILEALKEKYAGKESEELEDDRYNSLGQDAINKLVSMGIVRKSKGSHYTPEGVAEKFDLPRPFQTTISWNESIEVLKMLRKAIEKLPKQERKQGEAFKPHGLTAAQINEMFPPRITTPHAFDEAVERAQSDLRKAVAAAQGKDDETAEAKKAKAAEENLLALRDLRQKAVNLLEHGPITESVLRQKFGQELPESLIESIVKHVIKPSEMKIAIPSPGKRNPDFKTFDSILAAAKGGVLTLEMVDELLGKQKPDSNYELEIGTYTGDMQSPLKDRLGNQIRIMLHPTPELIAKFSQDEKMLYDAFARYRPIKKGNTPKDEPHPSALGWARISQIDNKTWFVEEIQSDVLPEMGRSALHDKNRITSHKAVQKVLDALDKIPTESLNPLVKKSINLLKNPTVHGYENNLYDFLGARVEKQLLELDTPEAKEALNELHKAREVKNNLPEVAQPDQSIPKIDPGTGYTISEYSRDLKGVQGHLSDVYKMLVAAVLEQARHQNITDVYMFPAESKYWVSRIGNYSVRDDGEFSNKLKKVYETIPASFKMVKKPIHETPEVLHALKQYYKKEPPVIWHREAKKKRK